MRRRFSALTILMVIVLVSLMACGPTPTPTPAPTEAPPPPTEAPAPTAAAPKAERPIKVGIIDSYNGPPAVYANDALNGFKLDLEEINKEGVLGKNIKYITRDTQFKVDFGLNLAQ